MNRSNSVLIVATPSAFEIYGYIGPAQFRVRVILSSEMAAKARTARRWFIHGRVQGVGFRYFVQRAAVELGLSGYVRNLEDGGVEAYAFGPEDRLSRLAALLRRGPRLAEVRTVEERTAEFCAYNSFEIEP